MISHNPEAIEFFKRCDLIVHAGDVGNPDILRVLRSIAPTYAIRGNIDKGSWAQELPEKDVLEEVLKNGSNQRDAKWTESIAIGNKELGLRNRKVLTTVFLTLKSAV